MCSACCDCGATLNYRLLQPENTLLFSIIALAISLLVADMSTKCHALNHVMYFFSPTLLQIASKNHMWAKKALIYPQNLLMSCTLGIHFSFFSTLVNYCKLSNNWRHPLFVKSEPSAYSIIQPSWINANYLTIEDIHSLSKVNQVPIPLFQPSWIIANYLTIEDIHSLSKVNQVPIP